MPNEQITVMISGVHLLVQSLWQIPIICFTDSGMIKLHEQQVFKSCRSWNFFCLSSWKIATGLKKKYRPMQASVKCSKIWFNRRSLVGKGNIQKALCCTALSSRGHGQWDALMELWKVSNMNFYIFFSTGHAEKLCDECQLLWGLKIKKEKKLTRKSLPAANKYHYKVFLQVRGKFRTSAASRSSCGMKVEIITFESSEDKKQNFKNVWALETEVINASQC